MESSKCIPMIIFSWFVFSPAINAIRILPDPQAQSPANGPSSSVVPLKPILPTGQPLKSLDQGIVDMCKGTENSEQCQNFVAPFVDGQTDPDSVLGMEIKALTRQLEQAIIGGEKLIKSSNGGVEKATSKSLDIYSEVSDDLDKALTAVSENQDIATAKTMLASAISKFGIAEEEFNKALGNGESSPLKQYNDLMIEMANFGLELITKINKTAQKTGKETEKFHLPTPQKTGKTKKIHIPIPQNPKTKTLQIHLPQINRKN